MFKCFVLFLVIICFAFIGIRETYYKAKNYSKRNINNAMKKRNRR